MRTKDCFIIRHFQTIFKVTQHLNTLNHIQSHLTTFNKPSFKWSKTCFKTDFKGLISFADRIFKKTTKKGYVRKSHRIQFNTFQLQGDTLLFLGSKASFATGTAGKLTCGNVICQQERGCYTLFRDLFHLFQWSHPFSPSDIPHTGA